MGGPNCIRFHCKPRWGCEGKLQEVYITTFARLRIATALAHAHNYPSILDHVHVTLDTRPCDGFRVPERAWERGCRFSSTNVIDLLQ